MIRGQSAVFRLELYGVDLHDTVPILWLKRIHQYKAYELMIECTSDSLCWRTKCICKNRLCLMPIQVNNNDSQRNKLDLNAEVKHFFFILIICREIERERETKHTRKLQSKNSKQCNKKKSLANRIPIDKNRLSKNCQYFKIALGVAYVMIIIKKSYMGSYLILIGVIRTLTYEVLNCMVSTFATFYWMTVWNIFPFKYSTVASSTDARSLASMQSVNQSRIGQYRKKNAFTLRIPIFF